MLRSSPSSCARSEGTCVESHPSSSRAPATRRQCSSSTRCRTDRRRARSMRNERIASSKSAQIRFRTAGRASRLTGAPLDWIRTYAAWARSVGVSDRAEPPPLPPPPPPPPPVISRPAIRRTRTYNVGLSPSAGLDSGGAIGPRVPHNPQRCTQDGAEWQGKGPRSEGTRDLHAGGGGGPARRFRRLTPGIDSLVAANLQRRLGDAYHTHADGP